MRMLEALQRSRPPRFGEARPHFDSMPERITRDAPGVTTDAAAFLKDGKRRFRARQYRFFLDPIRGVAFRLGTHAEPLPHRYVRAVERAS